jgi:hypothetical protein
MDRIGPSDMSRIFSHIKADYSFYEFSDLLGAAMVQADGRSWLSCKHIKEAAAVSPPQLKQAVCTAFARYCGDKQNAATEFAALNMSPNDLSTTLSFY